MSLPDGPHHEHPVDRMLSRVRDRLDELRRQEVENVDNVADLATYRAKRRAKRASYGAVVAILTGIAWLLRDWHWMAPVGIAAAAGVAGAILWGPPRSNPPEPPMALPPVTATPSSTVTSGSTPPAIPTPVPTTTPSKETTGMPTLSATTDTMVITRAPSATRSTSSVPSRPQSSTPTSTTPESPTATPGPRPVVCTVDVRLDPVARVCLLPRRR